MEVLMRALRQEEGFRGRPGAADAAADSKWAREDTPKRAVRVAEAMRTGRDVWR